MSRSLVVALLAVVIAAWNAGAQPQPVSGRRLVMVQTGGGNQRLVVLSRDTILAPTPGGADDPTVAGATLTIASGSLGETASFDLPAANWAVNASGAVFRYRNALAPGGPSAVKVTRLKNGSLLKVSAKSTGITLDEPTQGSILVSLVIGPRQYCATFGGTVLRDEPNRFIAKNAPAPGSCPAGGGGPTTTVTTVTSTTVTSTSSTLVAACPPPANILGSAGFTIQGGTADCGGAGFNTPAVPPFTGAIYDEDDVKMEDLGLGCFYAGGGLGNALPASSLPFNSKNVLNVGTVNGLALGLTASDGTGPLDCSRGAGPAKRCHDGSPGTDGMGACQVDADCGNGVNICLAVANCYFGAPIPLRPLTPTLSTCVMQAILTDACGSINLDTASASLTVALGARLYLTQDPVTPCPSCQGGTCTAGQRAGLPCSGGFGAENTTVECPPADSKFIGELLVNPLSVSSGTSDMVSDAEGYFCPGQVHRGALGTGVRARRIQQVGTLIVPGGPNLYTAQLGGNLCAPASGADLVDGVVDLPGPSTASVAGSIEICLLPDLCDTVCNPCTLGPLCDVICNPCALCLP